MKERIIYMTLKKKWFDMIASGIKKEEYREIKQYWESRLFPIPSRIIFKNGYRKDARAIIVECLGVDIGLARAEWSDNWKGKVFVLRLGKVQPYSPD